MTRDDARMLVHDLRAPLTAISGYTEMLRRATSDAEREELLGGLGRAARRMNEMLEAALRGEFGAAHSAARSTVRLDVLVAEAAEDARAASGRDILVESSPTSVAGDALLLRRAIDNLIGNAVKYSPADSPVEVAVTEDPGLTSATVMVSDRGMGIPAEERERVLLPFERLERDAAVAGTGLGLTVVASVAERHRGSLELLDRAGGGTSALLTLPAGPGTQD